MSEKLKNWKFWFATLLPWVWLPYVVYKGMDIYVSLGVVGFTSLVAGGTMWLMLPTKERMEVLKKEQEEAMNKSFGWFAKYNNNKSLLKIYLYTSAFWYVLLVVSAFILQRYGEANFLFIAFVQLPFAVLVMNFFLLGLLAMYLTLMSGMNWVLRVLVTVAMAAYVYFKM